MVLTFRAVYQASVSEEGMLPLKLRALCGPGERTKVEPSLIGFHWTVCVYTAGPWLLWGMFSWTDQLACGQAQFGLIGPDFEITSAPFPSMEHCR